MKSALRVLDLGRRAYGPVLALQERLVEERRAGRIDDTLILVEHDPVYTMGRTAKPEHVRASPAELAARGIEVVPTTRGGDVTYHGPGQIVGYPILDLGKEARRVQRYVTNLEEVIIRVLADFGIAGTRDSRGRGVWVGAEKVAALGVRIARQITMHGFALNVCVDLKDYGGIIPCGIADRGVTSLDRLVAGISWSKTKGLVVRRFMDVFGYDSRVDVAE